MIQNVWECVYKVNKTIITNNPRVLEKYGNQFSVVYLEKPFLDVLYHVRDGIHQGDLLLTHPLSGSVKPNETPYKSILIEKRSASIDMDSLMIIEDAIVMTRNLLKTPKLFMEDDQRMEDCRLIDLTLITSALTK